MAQVRFLDQVPVGVYNPNGTGGGGAVDVYYSGSLVLANVPFINFTGSTEVYTEIIGGIQGVTVLVSGSGGGSGNGFPFSGSAIITGSLIINGANTNVSLPITDILNETTAFSQGYIIKDASNNIMVKATEQNVVKYNIKGIKDASTYGITPANGDIYILTNFVNKNASWGSLNGGNENCLVQYSSTGGWNHRPRRY